MPSLLALGSALALTLACTGPTGDLPAGWQRVIVELRIDGLPPITDATARTDAIRSARESLIKELGSAPHRVTRTYDSLPFIALSAPKSTLDTLRQSPRVKGIQDDAVAHTQ